jgi:hypothetical protein
MLKFSGSSYLISGHRLRGLCSRPGGLCYLSTAPLGVGRDLRHSPHALLVACRGKDGRGGVGLQPRGAEIYHTAPIAPAALLSQAGCVGARSSPHFRPLGGGVRADKLRCLAPVRSIHHRPVRVVRREDTETSMLRKKRHVRSKT